MKNLFLFFSLSGFLISLYLSYSHYFYNPYVCVIDGNCNKVLTSKYSQIFNIPISLLGIIYFFILLISNFLSTRFSFFKKIIKFLVFIGFLVGLILIYLQIFILKTICFYCFLVDIILLILPIILILNKTKL